MEFSLPSKLLMGVATANDLEAREAETAPVASPAGSVEKEV